VLRDPDRRKPAVMAVEPKPLGAVPARSIARLVGFAGRRRAGWEPGAGPGVISGSAFDCARSYLAGRAAARELDAAPAPNCTPGDQRSALAGAQSTAPNAVGGGDLAPVRVEMKVTSGYYARPNEQSPRPWVHQRQCPGRAWPKHDFGKVHVTAMLARPAGRSGCGRAACG